MKVAGIGVMALVSALAAASALASAQTGRTVWDGVYTEAQAGRGKKLYIASCAACHQEGMQGADLAPALKGDEFLLLWNDKPMSDLVDRVAKTMPQDAPGTLSAEANADIVAYILQVNRFPTGAADLPPDAAAQKTISIVRTK
jgi:mono/diheme cytochrome c family protein